MKLLIIFLSIFVIVFCVPAPDKYSTKYDNLDVDSILRSDRLLRNYVNCFLDKTKCSPDAFEMKSHIKDALLTSCEKCNEQQKSIIKKVISFLIKNKRAMWDELEAKYDPDGTYRIKYEAVLKKEGLDI